MEGLTLPLLLNHFLVLYPVESTKATVLHEDSKVEVLSNGFGMPVWTAALQIKKHFLQMCLYYCEKVLNNNQLALCPLPCPGDEGWGRVQGPAELR